MVFVKPPPPSPPPPRLLVQRGNFGLLPARSRTFFLLRICLLWLLAETASGQTPNLLLSSTSAMQAEAVINVGLVRPTDFAWTPDLRYVLVVSKDGDATLFDAETFRSLGVVASLADSTCLETERGVQSVVFDPVEYAPDETYYAYIYHIRRQDNGGGCAVADETTEIPNPQGPTDRVSRFPLHVSSSSGATLDLGAEQVIFDTGPVGIKHNGGGMAFGSDGHLYVSTGDGGYRRGREAVMVTHADNLHGKVLRFTRTGDVPADNPLAAHPNGVRCSQLKRVPSGDASSTVVCQEIYSRGLRNPFNLAMDVNSLDGVRYYINDVGGAEWEEINEGGAGYEMLSYGWNAREGPCLMGKRDAGDCPVISDQDTVDPRHWYQHPSGTGVAVTGGTFVPLDNVDAEWSDRYGGSYLYSDYGLDQVYHLSPTNGNNYCRGVTCNEQVSSYEAVPIITELAFPVRMHFGPYEGSARSRQVLYVLKYGASGQLWRISSPDAAADGNGTATTTTNRRPLAVVRTFYTTQAGTDLTVQFDASASSDPDGDALTYTWNFGVDGAATSSGVTAAYTYTASGTYTATLTVDDGNGGTGEEWIDIHVYVGHNSLVPFVWSSAGCPATYDFCGVLDFCHDDSGGVYGYKLPCDDQCSPLQAPVIRLQPGKKYQLTLRNTAAQQTQGSSTNLHTHGLHVSGSGDADDVTRSVDAGQCLTYTWDVGAEHPAGTHWYHPHPHGHSEQQVMGGAFGFLIVEENTEFDPNVPAWAFNELLLQISRIDERVFGNKKPYEIFSISSNQWYRLRVSIVDPVGEPLQLEFVSGCDVHKVASDGIWHSLIPGPLRNQWEMTGASRGDFAIRCGTPDSTVNIFYNGDIAAIVNVGPEEATPYGMNEWNPLRPTSLQNIASADVPDENRFAISIQRETLNNLDWDPVTPLKTIAFDEVHEWQLDDTSEHPFHMHLYHMMVATPGGCGAHEEGEFYDTIAGPPCTVRFKTADIGQRCVFHCHVMLHSDLGAVGWVDVQGNGMPTNDVVSPEFSCPSDPLDQCQKATMLSSAPTSAPTKLQTAAPSVAQTTAVEGGTTAPQTAAPTVAQTTAVEGGTTGPQSDDDLTPSPTETPIIDPGSDARQATLGISTAAAGILFYFMA